MYIFGFSRGQCGCCRIFLIVEAHGCRETLTLRKWRNHDPIVGIHRIGEEARDNAIEGNRPTGLFKLDVARQYHRIHAGVDQ